MFCSTIIPTIGRVTLDRAVLSVLCQEFSADDFEVIVVNDSGTDLEPRAWQQSPRVTIVKTPRRERCVARNTGAAIARGAYLHFLDDDDWLLPGALGYFHGISNNSQASWLYGGAKLINEDGLETGTLHLGLSGNCFAQVMTGEWIPIQASMIRADVFFKAKGFDLHSTYGQDRGILERVLLSSDVDYTPATVVALDRNMSNSTTDYVKALQDSRDEREGVLGWDGVFSRMWRSANSAYWKGRIARLYFYSLLWNLEHHRVATAVSRLVYGLVSFCLAGPYIVSGDYRRGIARSHSSRLA